MDYWSDKRFVDIYFRLYRANARTTNPLPTEIILSRAKREYEELVKEEPKPQEQDYYVNVLGKPMLNSKWKELMEIQREKATEPTDNPDNKLKHYLKHLLQNE